MSMVLVYVLSLPHLFPLQGTKCAESSVVSKLAYAQSDCEEPSGFVDSSRPPFDKSEKTRAPAVVKNFVSACRWLVHSFGSE